MRDDGSQYIDAALQAGMLSGKQADLLREELFMFPGQNARQLMIKRHLITPEQLQMLESGEYQALDPDLELGAAPPPPPQTSGIRPALDPNFRPSTSGSATAQPQAASGLRPALGSAAAPPPIPPSPADGAGSGMRPSLGRGPRPAFQEPAGSGQHPAFGSGQGPALGSGQRPAMGSGQRPALGSGQRPALVEVGPPPIPQNDLLHPLGPDATVLDYLRMAREAGCSDLHLTVGRSPFVRYQGSLIFIDDEPLSPERSEQLNVSLLSEEQQALLREHLQLDFAYEEPGLGRHRCNVYRQCLGWEGEYRIVPREVPTLENLGLPPVLQRLTEYHQGLVLVTGPAGCGKTTTVAAMLDHINRHRSDHIITVEDPVEYVLQPAQCQITHREVGQHTQSFANALRAALRQDPDVISIGELRDLETTSIAISAAETGHLVFGTLHTNSALRTVARVMDVYPPAQRAQICTMVAESMRGVLSQQLVPRRDGNGRVCAMEVLIFTSGVAQLIKEGKTHQLVSAMQSGKRLGMRTMDDALMDLVDQSLISGREAYLRAENKPVFEAVRNQD